MLLDVGESSDVFEVASDATKETVNELDPSSLRKWIGDLRIDFPGRSFVGDDGKEVFDEGEAGEEADAFVEEDVDQDAV